jgi:hypothetical protein
MPPKKFVPDPEFFSDPDGLCSLALAKKAGIRYAEPPNDTKLIPLVVSGSPPAPSKAKLTFGHQVTKANAKLHHASWEDSRYSNIGTPAGLINAFHVPHTYS